MNLRSVLSFIFVLSLSGIVSGQYYDTGQDPANLKWLQIKTDRFRVIYPEKYGINGVEFARSLDKAYSDLSSIFPERKFRLPVVIHNFTTEANGYVAWAPKRMEVYPTPEQNSIPMDANRQLALHELTHVYQMESLNKGFTKAMSVILGQQFTGIVAALLPQWYMEGEAVFAETALSGSGRGRSPGFQKQLKALAIENDKLFKYDKMILGSYRNYVPDHYHVGYQMVTWSRINKDSDLWDKTLKYTANQPFTLNPVNLSLRRNAGLTKKSLYIQTFDTLKALWQKDIIHNGAKQYEAINPYKKGRFVNYYSPVPAGTDSVIAIKETLSEPVKFVLVRPSDKSEKNIHVPGNLYPYFLSYGGGKIVWVENRGDPRWENRDYSIIRLMDIKSGHLRKLSHRSRYMSAAISNDGNMIAASENTVENKNNLVLISTQNSDVTNVVPAPGNASLQRLQWSENGKKITVIFLTEDGEGIMSYQPDDGIWEILVEAGREDLQASFFRNDSLFYISSLNGTDNIYMLDPGKRLVALTNSRFGTNDFTIEGSTIMFSDYTSAGNDICTTSLKDVSNNSGKPFSPVSCLADQLKINIGESKSLPEKLYTPEPYRKWQHLFGIHSWMPFYADLDEIRSDPAAIRPGAMLMTQNLLSTLIATAGYEYSADNRHMFHSHVTWKGWYPVLESRFDYGNEAVIYNIKSNGSRATGPNQVSPGYQFVNTISLPLTMSSGRFLQYFYLSGSTNYQNNYLYLNESSSYSVGLFQLTGRFYFSNYHKTALRNLYPKWAQTIDLIYSWYPYEKNYLGSLLTLRSFLYFPGILKDNSIRVRLALEKQTNPYKYYSQGNRISFSRSYSNISSLKAEFLSVDYILPLVYPDFNIASLFYLKRIRAGLFYDYTRGEGNFITTYENGNYVMAFHDYPETFKSFGVELLSDFHLLRIPYMITAGVQTAFRSISETPYFGFLFNIDVYGMSIGRRMRM